MPQTHVGSCLCGAVRYEVIGDFERFYLCHCQHCRKDTGSAHAANLFSSQATLKWRCGEERVRFFNLPSTRHGRAFCSTCGSALPSLQGDGTLLVVPAGSLDTALPNTPDAHLFMASRADWEDRIDGAPRLDAYPA
ncbi:GFA family protein [Marilutibacter maris]|uniref:Aldehyde-activating protein n=1 Tax=Marilutibacter maris TaxID=1605891 RepID=A0A508AA66_9GAMM|nr:GFA family protein [Lysobacter maris]KAB8172522.1 aldehyde-activating protein [Lysobacter maris]